ncbi:sulfopyruvate decarboxylase subunit alpha [Streptomyces benahoarensis]|uniref:Sulfopyruvate decarboxylase subunit alpha n=2 Tax=Streptomyces TaxID=1883 RepID=A0A553ZRN4_9ACTN|nr:sulfopyruvate decarboxylase subunit alpha [Streptomyces benahoarensis]TSB44144.1 sulfopyruvate decarboxylase subunit alpha [Streptomyces benahoarensis]
MTSPKERDMPHETGTERPTSSESAVYEGLTANGFGPFFGTPCGVLAPLLSLLETGADYHVVAREDNAVGVAAGASLAGAAPVVLMQNSGFGQSVNALASLVVPYRIPMLLVVSMRGTPPDTTTENLPMGRLTEPVLEGLGIDYEYLTGEGAARQMELAGSVVKEKRQPFAFLIRPDEFAWKA